MSSCSIVREYIEIKNKAAELGLEILPTFARYEVRNKESELIYSCDNIIALRAFIAGADYCVTFIRDRFNELC